MPRCLHALRFAPSNQANAYGFTLVVWARGALAIWQLGKLYQLLPAFEVALAPRPGRAPR